MRPVVYLLALPALVACTSGTGAVRDPGSPVPATAPAPGRRPPEAPDDRSRGGSDRHTAVPVRPDDAPVVTVRQILEDDELVGRRVRVSGSCAREGAGRSKGSWTLFADNATIEVRGLVPSSCSGDNEETLTIFAQIEPKEAGSAERLLLRLPD
jgi:hypothetical protein